MTQIAQTISERQTTLLQNLVRFTFEGKLKDTIAATPTSVGDYVIYLQGAKGYRLKWISDLDALCDKGYLDYRWNRMSNGKLYSLTQAGIDAVWDNKPENKPNPSYPPQPTHDPYLLRKHLQAISPNLRQALAKILPTEHFTEASRTIAYIQDDVKLTNPDLTLLNIRISRLGNMIMGQFDTVQNATEAQVVAETLTRFGEWCGVVYAIVA